MLDQWEANPAVEDEPDGAAPNEVGLPGNKVLDRLHRWVNSKNICLEKGPDGEYEIDDQTLGMLGSKVTRKYEIDLNSVAEWRDMTRVAMDLAMQKSTAKQYPWPKASNVIFPLMTNASMQFAARAYPAIVENRNVVRGVVIGPDEGTPALHPQDKSPLLNMQTNPPSPIWETPPGGKQQRADRIGQHMSWQLLDEQPEWEPETDRLLHMLPIVGCAFRKSFFDPALGRNSSLVVSAMKLVINYNAKSIELASALTEEVEYYPNQITEMELAEVFREITYTSEPNANGDEDAQRLFLEQHCWWDADGDGYKEPYIITVHKASSQVVRIVARFTLDDIHYNASKHLIQKIDPVHYYTQYDFLPNPEGGIYGVGFGQILKPINESVNTTINMMIDAGHLQNVGGGFVGRGLSMNAGQIRFIPGEWKQVNAVGATIKDSLVPLPAPGPSQVLFQLLGLLIEAGKEVASIKDVLTGEQPANTPATTTLALIEQGLRAFTAIYKRIHRSLKAELHKLYRLNRLYLPEDTHYKIGDAWKSITRQDYEKGASVEPVSDPSMVSDMQKLGRSQFLLQFISLPFMNQVEIMKRVLKGANIDQIEALFNPNPPQDPKVQEAQAKLLLKARHDNALIEREQASALLMKAQAILALTAADKNITGMDVAWATHQLDIVRTGLEALGQGIGVDLPQPGESGAGPQLPGAQPGPGDGAAPEVGGAAVAPQQHYLPPTPAPGGAQ